MSPNKDTITIVDTEATHSVKEFPEIWEWGGVKLQGDGIGSERPRYSCNQIIKGGLTMALDINYQPLIDKPTFGIPTDFHLNIHNGTDRRLNPPIFGFGFQRNSDELSSLTLTYGTNGHQVDVEFSIENNIIVGATIGESERPSQNNRFQQLEIYPPTLFRTENRPGEKRETAIITNGELVKIFNQLGLPIEFKGGHPQNPEIDGIETQVSSFEELFKKAEILVYSLTHNQENILPQNLLLPRT